MKNIILILIIIIPFFSYAQDKKAEDFYEVHQIVKPQEFMLNSSMRTIIGGTNSTELSFKLPYGTVNWYYKFSSETIENEDGSNNLFTELTDLVSEGIYTAIIESLTAPTGVNVCDVMLYDGGYINNQGTRKMLAAGIVEVRPRTLDNKIIITNKSGNTSISVLLEVIAVVYNEQAHREYIKQKQQDDLNKSISNIVESSMAIKKARQNKKRAKNNKAEIEKQKIAEAEQKEMKLYMKLSHTKMENGEYDTAISILEEAVELNNRYIYVPYQLIAVAYREKEEYKKAIDYYNNSLEHNDNDSIIRARCHGGLGLTYLLVKDELKANKSYIQLAKEGEGTEEVSLAIKAIEAAKEKHGDISGADDIISFLKSN